MTDVQEFVNCSNWYFCFYPKINSGQQIQKSKQFLHESYCIKNLFKCRCGQIVEKKLKEQHEAESHAPAKCQFCGKSMEKGQIETHEESCPKKVKECPYCKSKIAGADFTTHVELCGNRTILCPRCKGKIPKKDWEQHQLVPCLPSGENLSSAGLYDKPTEKIIKPNIPSQPKPGTLPPFKEPQIFENEAARKLQEERDRQLAEAMEFEENKEPEMSPPPPEYKVDRLIGSPEYGHAPYPPSTSMLEDIMFGGLEPRIRQPTIVRPPVMPQAEMENELLRQAIEESLKGVPRPKPQEEERKDIEGIQGIGLEPSEDPELQRAIQESLESTKKK